MTGMTPCAVEILYDQGPCLVVNKPAGLLTQAPAGIDSLETRLRAVLQQRDNKPGEIYLGLPHRLDRPASGALLFGRQRRATRRLARQFEKRSVKKLYWAIVSGQVLPPEGTWIDYLRKVPNQARVEIAGPEDPDGRQAVLHYRTLRAGSQITWLEITLETGRMHQIRVQAAARGHPVLGDAQYGSTVPFGPQHEDWRLRAIALHARSLAFEHPVSRQLVQVTAPLPAAWGEWESA